MSTRDDAKLSAAERAALAGLESKAAADDPRLAAQLRGGGRGWPDWHVPEPVRRALRAAAGPLAVLAGLAAMVLALSASTPVALAGAVVFVGGMLLSAGPARAALEVLRGRRGGDAEPDRDGGGTARP